MYNTKMNEQRDVISVFHETAQKYSDKTAIASSGISLTYKQLDEESSRIASMLISSGNHITDILNEQLNTVVGLDDDLYELGLDSLSAIRVSSELKKMGYPISLKDVFMISTARELT